MTPTSTFTPTPNCCQPVTTLTGGSSGPFGSTNYQAVNNASTTLYLADGVDNSIDMFQLNNGIITSAAGTIGGVNDPYAIAIGPSSSPVSGYLFVADYLDGKIWELNLSTNNMVMVGQVSNPPILGLAVDINGDVYASMTLSPIQIDIFQYNSGNYSSAATITSGLSAPRGLLKVGNDLFVSDDNDQCVLEYVESSPYTFSGPTTAIPGVNGPAQLALDSGGNIYVAAGGGNYFSVYDPSFTQVYSCAMTQPTGIAVDGYGSVYTNMGNLVAAFPHCPSVSVYTPTPSYQGANPPSQGNCFVYPSPARGDHATLSYLMAQSGTIDLKILNENGELATQVTDRKPAGVQVTPFNISSLAPGVYFYVVTLKYDSGSTESLKVKKFIVIR